MARRARKLSFPKEHGALVTLAGATALAAATAPRPGLALLACAAVTAAYLSRGPIERRVAHLALRPWDAAALVLYVIAAGASVALLARADRGAAVAVGVFAAAFPVAGAAVRAVKAQRSIAVETLGLIAVGATAGVAAYAGHTPIATAGAMAAGMGAYGAAAILLVRAQSRDAERRSHRAMAALALVLLGAAAAGAAMLTPLLAVAFAPRAAHAALRIARPAPELSIYRIAARESAELAVFVALYATLSYVG